jgi:S1-C subfamily serine protease
MSESSQPPFGGPAPVPPPPDWVRPWMPWSGYQQPTSPGVGGVDPWSQPPPTGEYDRAAALPPPPPPPWQTRPWSPPEPPQRPPRNRAAIAVAVVCAVLSALVGVAIGSRLHRSDASAPLADAPVSTVAPSPAVPIIPSGPGTGSDPSTPTNPTTPAPGNGATTSPPSSAQAGAIAAKVNHGIVDINTRLGYQNAAGAGTGIILTSSGQVLTNNHVIAGATSIRVTLVATGRTYTAKVVGTDPTDDIAVIQIQGVSGLSPIPLGDSSALSRGDPVVAIGNAGGVGGPPSAVTGTIQALNQSITASDGNGANAERLTGLIQINAPIQPGDSGGPLVNSAAQVIGIDTAASTGNRFQASATVGFAIPIAHALDIAGQINSGQASATIHIGLPGFLGVQVLPAGTGVGNGSRPVSGALVAGVEPGSPAAGAGMVAGDTITALDGHVVDAAQTLTTLTRSHHPGDKVTVTWTDQSGASRTAKVTLAVGPAD